MSLEIGSKQGPPSKLDPNLAKDLRSHHVKDDMGKSLYSTTYKDAFQDFPEGTL
jgi:hypothetical protein